MTKDEFITTIANMVPDGDCGNCGQDGYYSNPKCEEHEPYEPSSDDQIDTLNNIIAIAREFVAQPSSRKGGNLMASDHLNRVVQLENAELNEIADEKARVRLREIRMLTKQRDALNERIAKYRQELIDMKWDEVSIDDVLGQAPQQ